jgi:hypothetical protein
VRPSVGAALLATAVLAAAGPARAETPEELFDRGWEAMERRDYEAACALFDQSYAQSRATGPLQGLAACFEKRGLLRQAMMLWRDAERTLPADSPSLPEASQAVKRLRARLAIVTFELPPNAPPETSVQVDGELVPIGKPVEIDPGVNHAVTISASGERPRRFDLRLGEGEKKTMSLAYGTPVEPAAPPPTVGPIRGAGIGLVALGAVGFAAAAVTGGIMMGHEQTIDDGCDGPDHTQCNATALAASDSAKDLGPWNIAAWVVGITATGAGVPMIIVGDGPTEAPSSEVAVVFAGPSIAIRGRF